MGWYYHNNSEMYFPNPNLLISGTKSSLLRYFQYPSLLTASTVHVGKERFPCMNFVERSNALTMSRRCKEVEYGYHNGDPYTIRTTYTIYILRTILDLLCMSMSHNTFLTKVQSLSFHSFLCFLRIFDTNTLIALELPGG